VIRSLEYRPGRNLEDGTPGGLEDGVGIPVDMDEFRIREQFEEQPNTAGVAGRLEHQRLSVEKNASPAEPLGWAWSSDSVQALQRSPRWPPRYRCKRIQHDCSHKVGA